MTITLYKHISVRGSKQTTTQSYAPVVKYTRAGYNGKQIMCPECGHVHRVYHFSWANMTCNNCMASVDKNDWLEIDWKY